MTTENGNRKKPTLLFTVALLVTALSGVPYAFSALNSVEKAEQNMLLIILYPVFALLAVYLAYKIYADRRPLAMIILALVWLSLLAEFVLISI